jgi:FAD/FMN-containing dehydrogenase
MTILLISSEVGGEGAYAGYAGVEEGEWEQWERKIFDDNYDRLRTLKARYDPAEIFDHGLSVTPKTEQ